MTLMQASAGHERGLDKAMASVGYAHTLAHAIAVPVCVCHRLQVSLHHTNPWHMVTACMYLKARCPAPALVLPATDKQVHGSIPILRLAC